jgi:hypothetical protein
VVFTGRPAGHSGGMPPFLRLLPLPRQLTTDLPRPIAAGIGLAVSLPATAARAVVSLPQTAVGAAAKLLGRYADLAALGASVVRGRPHDEDDEPFPTYASLDTGAWGAADTEAQIVRLFEAGEDLIDPLAPGGETDDLDAVEQAIVEEVDRLPAPIEETAAAGESALPAPADEVSSADAVEEATAALDETAPEVAAADATLEAAAQSAGAPALSPVPAPTPAPLAAVPPTAAPPATPAHDGTVPPALAHDSSPAAQFLTAAIEDRTEAPATAPTRAALPIEGYDGLSAAALRGRLAGLTKNQLATVRDYEAAHAKRVTVLAQLERLIAKASPQVGGTP